MNIEEIKINYDELSDRDLIEVIFQRQKRLMDLYELTYPLDLDLPRDQQVIRSFAWSTVEEMGEALEVQLGSQHREHLLDEIADMMHFYVEVLILSDLHVQDFFESMNFSNYDELKTSVDNPDCKEIDQVFREFVVEFALSINVLKNRLWRKTNLPTNKEIYREQLKKTIPLFWEVIKSLGLNAHDVVDAYLRKNEINLFRIKSRY